MRVIDPKYHIEGEKIIKTSNGEEIPDDEPLILFRARDNLALAMLKAYLHLFVRLSKFWGLRTASQHLRALHIIILKE